jgi:hypothetical protein
VQVSPWSLFSGRASAQLSLISSVFQVQLLGPELFSRSGLEAGSSSVSYAAHVGSNPTSATEFCGRTSVRSGLMSLITRCDSWVRDSIGRVRKLAKRAGREPVILWVRVPSRLLFIENGPVVQRRRHLAHIQATMVRVHPGSLIETGCWSNREDTGFASRKSGFNSPAVH